MIDVLLQGGIPQQWGIRPYAGKGRGKRYASINPAPSQPYTDVGGRNIITEREYA